ncbi:MAG: pitrilysin family protein [bacterium]|nr:pitrilysin family protein [bacterium]
MKLKIIFLFTILLLSMPAPLPADGLFTGLTQKQLANGLTVLLLPDTTKPIVSVQVWLKVGVCNETHENNGISHFIEHMLFKGTATRPVNSIQEAVESKGGMINGATGKDFTYYYINLPGAYWSEAVSILADMVQNASFDAKELEKERLVVIEEIQRQNDEPQAYLWNKFNETIFRQAPYRMTILGTADNLKSLSRETLQQYYSKNYKPENMTLIISGDFPQGQALARINELFPTAPKGKPVIKKVAPVIVESYDDPFPRKIELPFQVNLVYHMIGFLGPAIDHRDQYALDLLATMLGAGRSSRLNGSLREEKQLVYNISSSFLSQRGNGIFQINALYPPNRIPEVTSAIMAEISRFSLVEVPDEELAKAKQMLTAGFILDNQTRADKANTLGYYASIAKYDYALKYLDEIKRVSKQDILRVAKKYLGHNFTSILLLPEMGQKN